MFIMYFSFLVMILYSATNDDQWPPLNYSIKYEFLNFIKIHSLQPSIGLFEKAYLTFLKQQQQQQNIHLL